MDKIETRQAIIGLIRDYFIRKGFVEVETPLLVPCPDPSPCNEVFEILAVGKKRAFLAPSPEFFMKRLIANGFKRIFQICKAFRNPQETGPLHNPEFTILEWYRTGADYTDLMVDSENLVNFIYKSFLIQMKNEKLKIKNYKAKIKNLIYYQDQKIDIAPPWIKLSVKEVFKKYAKVNLDEFLDFRKAKEIAKKRGYRVEKDTTWEQIYHQVFLNEVEPKLPKDKSVILYDYPAQLAEGAKLKDSNLKYAERFEFYIGGLELGNGYSELTNWQEQEKRFKIALTERQRLKMKVFDYDHDFINVLKKGLPKCAGMAVGIDRLIMLFTNAKTIKQVIPFPETKIFSS